MIDIKNICALRMARQCLNQKASRAEYDDLYKDLSPGQNVYWCGFGNPPSLSFRADFDDIAYNRQRQRERILVKGRFQGGNLGWIEKDDMELFACLFRKKIDRMSEIQTILLDLIKNEGPMNIGIMKEMTGLLVKEITPALHKLQEAFIVYEDQYDGEWDRAWYRFEEMFPDVRFEKYSRNEALKSILLRFAYRSVMFDTKMAKSFYRLPEKEIKNALSELVSERVLMPFEQGYILKTDYEMLKNSDFDLVHSVFALHRNDFLVKSNEHLLKEQFSHQEYDTLQYLLIDGEFHGIVAGKFKNGPYILEDVLLDLPEQEKTSRKDEILDAVFTVNDRDRSPLAHYCGQSV